jgi:hypothetical protein
MRERWTRVAWWVGDGQGKGWELSGAARHGWGGRFNLERRGVGHGSKVAEQARGDTGVHVCMNL